MCSTVGRVCCVTGIHIGEPVGRYLPQHPLDVDIKVEVDGTYLESLGASGGMGPGGMGPGGVPSPGPGPGRTRKNKEDKICGVCGDRALGYNFDAISCESCKAFFRRNAPKGLVSTRSPSLISWTECSVYPVVLSAASPLCQTQD